MSRVYLECVCMVKMMFDVRYAKGVWWRGRTFFMGGVRIELLGGICKLFEVG